MSLAERKTIDDLQDELDLPEYRGSATSLWEFVLLTWQSLYYRISKIHLNRMPVDFDEYTESENYDHWLQPGSNAHTILSFLAEYPDQGFTPTEIHAEVEIPMGSIGPTLQRLEERDLVRHKGSYWAIAQDDRITAFESTIHAARAVSARADEWGDVDWDAEAVDESEIEAWRESQTDE